MFYSVDGKIVKVGEAFAERRVNTLTFEVTGDTFPKAINLSLYSFIISFSSLSSFTLNYGDGVVQSFNNVSYYNVGGSNPEGAHKYTDGNTGSRLVTFTFEDITLITSISIGFCEVKGSFPVEAGFIENLTVLNLRSTDFDSFPESFFKLRNLTQLTFRKPFNFKFPAIFDGVFNNKLTSLTLSNSFDLEEHTPSNFFKINQLRDTLTFLNCEQCNLKDLPSEITELYKLKGLWSLFNEYTKIPIEITQIPTLEVVKIGRVYGSNIVGGQRDIEDPTMIQFTSDANKITDLTFRISNLEFFEIPTKWTELKSLETLGLFGDMVTSNARFDEFIDVFYELCTTNGFLDPTTQTAIDTGFPNQFRNITWGAGNLTQTGVIQAPAGFELGVSNGNLPMTQGEKIYVLVNNYGHNVITSGNFN